MGGWWIGLQESLNNREIATGFWVILLLGISLFNSKIRPSVFQIIKGVLSPKLLFVFTLFALNIVCIVAIIKWLNLWGTDQIPATMLWFLLSGLALLFRSVGVKENEKHFTTLFKDSFRIAIIFEFIVVAYTYSLSVELFLVPFMALLGVLLAVSEMDKKYAQTKTVLGWIIALIVIAILWHSVSEIWNHSKEFFTSTTVLNFILPILLTVGSIPFLYVFFCYTHIEGAIIQINQKTFQSDDLKRYAKQRFLLVFFLRPWLLRRATRQFHIQAETNADVDQIIFDILHHVRSVEEPPKIDPKQGWSPYIAIGFLQEEGLLTGDYHKGFDDEWWANSPPFELDEQILPNTVTYSIEGIEGTAQTLKLYGHFNDEFEPILAVSAFENLAQKLLLQSADHPIEQVAIALSTQQDFNLSCDAIHYKWRTERFHSDRGFNIHFTISHN